MAAGTACRGSGPSPRANPNPDVLGLPRSVGPLAQAHWPAASIAPDQTVNDSGTSLIVFDKAGAARTIWTHARVTPSDISVSPDGRSIALSVGLGAGSAGGPTGALYLLDSDGSVRTLDVATDGFSIATPIFVTVHDRPVLRWLRFKSDLRMSDDRLPSEEWQWDGSVRRRVSPPLRYGEGLVLLSAFPGNEVYTVEIGRRVAEPTELEVLTTRQDLDGELVMRANTNSNVGTAWISKSDYVVAVTPPRDDTRVQLIEFRVGCEYRGGHVVYNGSELGSTADPWYIVPAPGGSAVFVVTAASAGAPEPRWQAVDLATGAIAPTVIPWNDGAWTASASTAPSFDNCDGITFDFP